MAIASSIIGGALALGGAVIGSSGAKSAANAQAQSNAEGIAEQRRQYDLTRADMAPWRTAGASAIGQLAGMLQPGYDHTTSPGYQFRFGEGQRAVESGAASKGLLMSGGTLKDLTRYGQGVAAQDFGDQFNRVASVASGGQQANTSLGQLGAQSAGNISSLLQNTGQARASGYINSTNAITSGIAGLGSIFKLPGF